MLRGKRNLILSHSIPISTYLCHRSLLILFLRLLILSLHPRWIQQAIFRSMAYSSRTIRLPVHIHNLLSRIRRVKVELQVQLGRAPTGAEIAKELDMPPEKLAKMLRLTRKSISMDMPKYQSNPKDAGHASEENIGDMIDSTSHSLADNNSPEVSVNNDLFHEYLRDMLQVSIRKLNYWATLYVIIRVFLEVVASHCEIFFISPF
jgi:hypothetical protein